MPIDTSAQEAVLADLGRRTDEMVDVRRALHAAPELSFEEVATTALVRERLAAARLTLEPCPTATGAVASLEGATAGPTVLLRADIDALPVHEPPGPAYASRVEGVMHACGHDAHTAVLLGVAASLAACADVLPGRYVFVFQPAEERVAGARAMVDGGLLDGFDPVAALGVHVISAIPVGVVAARPGLDMAGAEALRVVATGAGGHGSDTPRRGNLVVAVSQLADRLHTVVEGLSTEGAPCVCTPAAMHAGTAYNVVPTRAELWTGLRWFEPEQRAEALRRLDRLMEEIAADLAVEMTVETAMGTGPLHNDPTVTAVVLDQARRLLPGATVSSPASPLTASDDMSVLLDRVPGCYVKIGAGLPDRRSGAHHTPTFAIDEGAIPIAAAVLATSAVALAAGPERAPAPR